MLINLKMLNQKKEDAQIQQNNCGWPDRYLQFCGFLHFLQIILYNFSLKLRICRRSILLQFSKGQKKGSCGARAVARLAVRYATNPACGARSKRVVLPWGATGPCRGARARGAIPAGDFHYKGRRISCQYSFFTFFSRPGDGRKPPIKAKKRASSVENPPMTAN